MSHLQFYLVLLWGLLIVIILVLLLQILVKYLLNII